MRQSHQHQVRQHLDVVVVIQSIFHVFQELIDIYAVETGIQQRVHAFKGSLKGTESTLFQCPKFVTLLGPTVTTLSLL